MENVKRLLAEVPHWCSLEKAEWIYNKVIETNPQIVVEIGVYGGGSFFAFAFAMKKFNRWCRGSLIGIDPWCVDAAMQGIGDDDAKKIDFDKIYEDFMARRYRERLQYFTFIRRDKACNIDDIRDKTIDILHVDGNHSFESVVKDLMLYLPRMKENGIIIIDDINWPTVASALEQFPNLKQTENHTTWGVYENRINNA
jgi:predicted O-methyltransferase YrrM